MFLRPGDGWVCAFLEEPPPGGRRLHRLGPAEVGGEEAAWRLPETVQVAASRMSGNPAEWKEGPTRHHPADRNFTALTVRYSLWSCPPSLYLQTSARSRKLRQRTKGAEIGRFCASTNRQGHLRQRELSSAEASVDSSDPGIRLRSPSPATPCKRVRGAAAD